MTDTGKPVEDTASDNAVKGDVDSSAQGSAASPPTEHGGPKGLDPTRYGDWERNGRCYDF